MPSKHDRAEFKAYCRTLTDNQVLNVIRKEKDAGRTIYAEIAEAEAERRRLL